MSDISNPKPDLNSWLEDELYQQYLSDHRAVDETWKRIFETNGHTVSAPAQPANVSAPENGVAAVYPPASTPAAPVPSPFIPTGPGDQLVPLRGAAARIAGNMTASLGIPVATSQRVISVKVIDENRRLINEHRALRGQTKVSYTHLVSWAILRALDKMPALNQAFSEAKGEPCRIVRDYVNFGIAIDVAGKDGGRSLMVPNVKNAHALDFEQFLTAYDELVARTRAGNLAVTDFQGTTISLTNPGTVGTIGSIPRLMPGQGAIIATGAIDFPPEYHGVADEVRASLGIGKVMSVTCTYDHRVIQGAESGMFLGRLQGLLQGDDSFYERIFADLKIPYQPVRWEADRRLSGGPMLGGAGFDIAKIGHVHQLINAHRVRGHLIADLDPIGSEPGHHPELDPATYGFTIWDLDRQFPGGSLFLDTDGGRAGMKMATLREILDRLRHTYCGKLTCEYMHIQHPEQKRWLQQRMEPETNQWPLEVAVKLRILERIVEAEGFEHFLHARFVGHKRFSLEGGESAIAVLDELLERAANGGVHEMVIGMAHRGRLNVLANIVGKSMLQLFSEFEGDVDPESIEGSGDVKYHLGASGVRRSSQNREIVVSVAFNPSHLEAVDPVVEGITRPKQDRLGDARRERVIPVLVHGDAAFAGQGVIQETLNLSQLEGYTVGGTIHLIINNQIGFTTNPIEGRSSTYSSDVARMVQAPIFHVNADDPEACVRAVQLALDYRQQFRKDVVIDMMCYRRHGHNEADDPSYTQPLLYRKIRAHKPVAALYAERLIRENVISAPEVDAMRKRVVARLNEAYDLAQQKKEHYELQELSAVDAELIGGYCPRTAAPPALVKQIVHGLSTFPETFHLHPKLRPFVERRKEALQGGHVDWALAEAVAFGTLLLEGTPIRLSGQDSSRGTFSQRHLEFHDVEDGSLYCPMKNLAPNQARFEVWDSALSEYAAMGFEFGYSAADPLTLVIWEAQFGDFSNGAQIMIDQFISSAESKWGQPSGLVLLLPHGYEGQGPEHSSARIERFLQLCAESNMQVANCTTPAQYFHLLRRQMYGGPDRRGVRKPLIVFTPKSLLRHGKAVSTLDELASGGFREILPDTAVDPARADKILLCSGKVYYDLLAAREERKADRTAIVRMEQLYPFASGDFIDILMRYPAVAEVVWVQEEPGNMGPWHFLHDQVQPILDASGRRLHYVGRPESASTAPGSLKRHLQEQAYLVGEAFTTPIPRKGRTRLVPKRKASK